MKYRNTKTGVVIDVENKISGKYWELVETPSKKPVKKRTVKK
jgi:hypothetical protein